MSANELVLHIGLGQCKVAIPEAAAHLDSLADLLSAGTEIEREHVACFLRGTAAGESAIAIVGPDGPIRQLGEDLAGRGVPVQIESYAEPQVNVSSMDIDQRTARWQNHFYEVSCIGCRTRMIAGMASAANCPKCGGSIQLSAPVEYAPLPDTAAQRHSEFEAALKQVTKPCTAGDYTKALHHVDRLYRMCRNLKEGSEERTAALDAISKVYLETKSLSKAEGVFRELLACHQAAHGRVSEPYAIAADQLGAIYAGMKHVQQAERAVAEAAQVYAALKGEDSPEHLRCLKHLAEAQDAGGKPHAAAASYGKLAELNTKLKHGEAAVDALMRAGRLHCEDGDFIKGRECFVAAMDVAGHVGGSTFILARYGMAKYCYVVGDYDAALSIINDVHQVVVKMRDRKPPLNWSDTEFVKRHVREEQKKRNYVPLPELVNEGAAAASQPVSPADGGWSLEAPTSPQPKTGAARTDELRSKVDSLLAKGRPGEAIPLAEQMCHIAADVDGLVSLEHAKALELLAIASHKDHLWDEAERYLRLAMTICNRSTDPRAAHRRKECMWRLANVRLRKFEEPREYAMNYIDHERLTYLPKDLRDIIVHHDRPKWQTTFVAMAVLLVVSLILWVWSGWCLGILGILCVPVILLRHTR